MIVDLFDNCFITGRVFAEHTYPWMFAFEVNTLSYDLYYEIADIKYRSLPHVGVAAREGLVVMYQSSASPSWMVVDVFAKTKKEHIDMRHMLNDKEKYKILIIGPLFARITKLYLELPEGATVKSITSCSKQILVTGGIHSSGGGCTTSAFCIAAILARKTGCCVDINTLYKYDFLAELRQSLERAVTVCERMPRYDAIIFEGDHYRQDDSIVQNYLGEVLSLLSEMTEDVIVWSAIPKEKEYKRTQLEETVKNFKSETKYHCLDLSKYFDDLDYSDMCTYSNNFLNDTGMSAVYNELSHVIQRILWK